jgi:asparagine N-glycosylation enzyme membrane subunit Stt3
MRFVWRCVSGRCTILTTEANVSSSWLVYKIVDIIRYRAVQHPAVIASGIVTNVFIIISVLSAFPWIRKSVIPSSDVLAED